MIRWSFFILLWVFNLTAIAQNNNGRLEIFLTHGVNGKPLILNDSTYTNPYNEPYSVKKLKYYLTDFYLDNIQMNIGKDPYVLIDASKEYNIVQSTIPVGNYHTLRFKLGVDSLDNCSGAQTGALDPSNDMFWTWNSGYVFFKFEGFSDSSKADLNRLEYHLGGYQSGQNLQTEIRLEDDLLGILVSDNKNWVTRLTITLDLNRFWGGRHDGLKIADMSLCMKPGIRVNYFVDQFKEMFRITEYYIAP